MHPKLIAPLAAVLAVAACAKPAPPVLQASDPRNDGIAKTCTPANPDNTKPGPYTGSITMTNDGWCGVSALDKDGKPFSLALVRTRPSHGRVFNQEVANARRVEYTPDAGYAGSDSFVVALRSSQPGVEDVPMTVNVTVTQGEGQPAVAAPPTTTNRPAASAAPRAAKAAKSTKRKPASSSR